MKKILCVGCSFTYGDELKSPEKDSWPILLGKFIGGEVVNLGKPSGSNDYTIRTIFENIHANYDLIIVSWTDYSRIEIYDGRNERPMNLNLGAIKNYATGLRNWTEMYYKYFYNDQHNYYVWLTKVILLQEYLKSKNQPYLFFNTFQHMAETNRKNNPNVKNLIQQIDKTPYINFDDGSLQLYSKEYPIGPNSHPLEEGHTAIAKKIYSHLAK